MASGYVTSSGKDLDSVFAPTHTGWPQASATEFFDGSGNDLYKRYATLATGTAAGATEFVTSAGADLNTLFAAYGTTNVKVLTQPSNVSGSSAAGNPSGTVTSGSTTCAFTKGKGSYTYTWHCTNCTANSPNSATTTFSATVSAASTVTGSAYCTGSDGVTSANTNTISVTLQNTSPAGWNFTLVAGQSGSVVGFSGGDGLLIGTLNGKTTPVQMTSGYYALEIADDGTNTYLVVSGLVSDPGQSSLTSLIINGKTFTGSSASYLHNSNNNQSSWTWSNNSAALTNGHSYTGTLSGTVAV